MVVVLEATSRKNQSFCDRDQSVEKSLSFNFEYLPFFPLDFYNVATASHGETNIVPGL